MRGTKQTKLITFAKHAVRAIGSLSASTLGEIKSIITKVEVSRREYEPLPKHHREFGAVFSLQMAMAAPPHLKAIIARSGTDDPYTEWTNPGGSPRPYMYENYSTTMTARNFSPPDPGELGERWAKVWAERLEKNVPWGISFIWK